MVDMEALGETFSCVLQIVTVGVSEFFRTAFRNSVFFEIENDSQKDRRRSTIRAAGHSLVHAIKFCSMLY